MITRCKTCWEARGCKPKAQLVGWRHVRTRPAPPGTLTRQLPACHLSHPASSKPPRMQQMHASSDPLLSRPGCALIQACLLSPTLPSAHGGRPRRTARPLGVATTADMQECTATAPATHVNV